VDDYPSMTAKATETQRDVDEIAAELYALRPDGFAAAREDAIKKARSAGQVDLARELGKLRRPTQSAWVVNLLWYQARKQMEEYLGLADDLSQAQAAGSVVDLQKLGTKRREFETALVRQARRLAEEAGVELSATMERDLYDTLGAALMDPEATEQVRSGRLLKPLSYAGFGVLPAADAVQKRVAEREREQPRPPERRLSLVKKQAQAEPMGRTPANQHEAQRLIKQTGEAAQKAAAALDERKRAAEAAGDRYRQVSHQIERVQEELATLKKQASEAERGMREAERERHRAEREYEVALRSLERAEKRAEKGDK